MAVITILHDIAPQFIDDVKNERFIGYATPLVSSCQFGDSYELAVAYLSAHLLEVAKRGGNIAGFLSSITEGQRTLSYNSVQPKDADLATTSYGVEFKRLQMMYVTPIFITGGASVSCH